MQYTLKREVGYAGVSNCEESYCGKILFYGGVKNNTFSAVHISKDIEFILFPFNKYSKKPTTFDSEEQDNNQPGWPFLEFALHDAEPPFARNGSITPRAMIGHNCDRSSLWAKYKKSPPANDSFSALLCAAYLVTGTMRNRHSRKRVLSQPLSRGSALALIGAERRCDTLFIVFVQVGDVRGNVRRNVGRFISINILLVTFLCFLSLVS
ncbi:hypothetical protein CDAR_169421 [Caerostris darwini]|uniref:Uncharacterized protein n=1 Tax=Caerostris darwini TaxID=1538125 RepID=A0AAV4QKS8_9ARAC|nr:hypothetical protein CDAR_169421 [Caerostris darwini]